MSATGRITGAMLAAGAIGALVACADGFFAPGASRPPARLAIAVTVAPAGGSAAAFDRSDALRVRIVQSNASVLDTTLAFRSAGDETRVRVALEISSSSQDVGVEVELRSGGQAIFTGVARATLKPGETTPVTIELAAVPTDLRLAAVPTFTAIGDTGWVHGAVVFATGDTIRALRPTYVSLNPYVFTVASDSMLVARGEGQAQLQAVYGTLLQTTMVTVSATPASIVISPRDPAIGVGPFSVQFSAVVRDRRGNALTRTVTWTSRDTSIVQIDAAGVARPGRLGTTYIVGSVGTLRDSTTFTVAGVIVPPNAPISLTASAVSSAEARLSWTDNSTDETGFYIERCTGVECTAFVQISSLTGNTARVGSVSAEDTRLSASTAYTYRVRAYNGSGTSAYSNTATVVTNPPEIIPPGTPDSLTATVYSSTQINVRWKRTGYVATGFSVERCAGAGCSNFAVVYTAYGAYVGGIDDGYLTPATSYTYRIRAFNGYGYSGYSNTATAITPP